ncbi:MAG: RagB/SusD family nutrient uptake outer membrane protein [Balneolaceae bacterium]|nr:MAG: RagB/SusD family nutrient uptake outer membrane protein [Balneolaceae bacterium]
MKNLKLFKHIAVMFTLLLSLLVMNNCSDFLNNPIEGQVPVDDIDYTDDSRMYEPVASVYAQAAGNTLAHWSNQAMLRFRSDFVFKAGHAGDQPIMEDIQDFQYETMRNAWFVNNLWTQHFGLIRDANASLQELELFGEHTTDTARLNQYMAEVRWFRALGYWRMMRFYGDVPYYNAETIAAELRLSPRDEVYEYVVSELTEILDHLSDEHPSRMSPRRGSVTTWAAHMLLAKIAADFQDYQSMLEHSQAIVQSGLFSLYPDYYELFKYAGQLSDENIFELQFTDFGTSDGPLGGNIDQYYVFDGIKQSGGTKYDGSGFTGGWGFSMPAQKYLDLMEEREEGIRYETTIIDQNTATAEGDSIGHIPADLQDLLDRYNNEGRGVAESYFFKTYIPYVDQTPGRHRFGGFNNVRMFRYAEALLLYAEALIHINGPGAGDAYINEVRDRAGMPPISGATIDDIIDERAAELTFEWGADRFFDLVRLDRAEGTIPFFRSGEHEFFPIPVVQIDLQPGLAEPPVPGIQPPTP